MKTVSAKDLRTGWDDLEIEVLAWFADGKSGIMLVIHLKKCLLLETLSGPVCIELRPGS